MDAIESASGAEARSIWSFWWACRSIESISAHKFIDVPRTVSKASRIALPGLNQEANRSELKRQAAASISSSALLKMVRTGILERFLWKIRMVSVNERKPIMVEKFGETIAELVWSEANIEGLVGVSPLECFSAPDLIFPVDGVLFR
ncbi:hypothetical protein R1flu_013416 [Riccia fluitans]|uniref:Uncharacterized protein n=1 Tax=Riccia fluitans TaxID=41844 RepID=A0ABD1YDG6_9MARC